MKCNNKALSHRTLAVITSLLFIFVFDIQAQAQRKQSIQKQKMEQLSHLVGEWIGTAKLYENGEITSEIPAYESIAYDLDSSILVVKLNSEKLQLHTIIYYDTKDETYYYYPFSKRGVRGIPATLENGNLIVHSSETRRYVFGITPEGGFREYGEVLVDGKWVKYFQDDFVNTK
ncbi:MAG: hypothetical protein SchgKO_05560 [Schleiferiaceae bacterium]